MKRKDSLVSIFSGTEITVNLLKSELEKGGIFGIVQNDYRSGIIAGFSGGGPAAVDLLIPQNKLKEAEATIHGFLQRNKD